MSDLSYLAEKPIAVLGGGLSARLVRLTANLQGAKFGCIPAVQNRLRIWTGRVSCLTVSSAICTALSDQGERSLMW